MSYTLRITAQLYQNYSDTNIPYWKPKGGIEFTASVTTDMRFEADNEEIKELAIELLAAESNTHERVEYHSHEIIGDAIDVTAKFKELFDKKFNGGVDYHMLEIQANYGNNAFGECDED